MMTNLPSLKSCIASSMLLSGTPASPASRLLRCPACCVYPFPTDAFHVLRDDVYFQVDRIAHPLVHQRHVALRVGDQRHGEAIADPLGHGQADAVERDEPLLDDVA